MYKKSLTTLSLVAALVGVGVFAYAGPEEAANEELGVVAGVVKFVGDVPAPTPVTVTGDNHVCGDESVPEDLVVGPGAGLQWAVVRVLGIEGEVPTDTVTMQMDQNGCRFIPHVAVAVAGQPFKVINSDGVLHNFHTHSEANSSMNLAQPGMRREMPVTFESPEFVRVTCDVHTWMQGIIVVADNPYVAVTAEDGSFMLPALPAGTYQVAVWHERLGEHVQEVTVDAGGTASLSFDLSLQ